MPQRLILTHRLSTSRRTSIDDAESIALRASVMTIQSGRITKDRRVSCCRQAYRSRGSAGCLVPGRRAGASVIRSGSGEWKLPMLWLADWASARGERTRRDGRPNPSCRRRRLTTTLRGLACASSGQRH